MKSLLCTLLLAIIIIGCATTQDKTLEGVKGTTDRQEINDTIRIENDSLEYEIIIIEQGFNSWLVSQPPRGFFSQSTLETRNCFSVNAYNIRANDIRFVRTGLYDQRINYNCQTDYGYEVNYLLYNYFEFFEEKYNQRLR